jgi:hypothetical protein
LVLLRLKYDLTLKEKDVSRFFDETYVMLLVGFSVFFGCCNKNTKETSVQSTSNPPKDDGWEGPRGGF